ncbi:unnamed protein product [Rhodiola kirilowii]
MPDTRSTTEAITTITQDVAELSQRQAQFMEMMEQMRAEMQANSDEMRKEIRELKLHEARAEKQPMHNPPSPTPTNPSSQPPLLPTPINMQPYASNNNSHGRTHQAIMNIADNAPTGGNRLPRIDVPLFCGEAVEGWVFQMERYFNYNNIPPEQKLTVATFYLGGEALRWYQWLYSTQQLGTWERFATDVAARFGPPAYYKPELVIQKLLQIGPVATYISEFETLSTRTPGLTHENLLIRFMARLKDEIQTELILLNPTNLRMAMGMARVAEHKVNTMKSWHAKSYLPRNYPSFHGPSSSTSVVKALPSNQGTPLPIKRLSSAEMAARREKGLCYNCDEKYGPGHRCKPRFQCFLIEEDGHEEELLAPDHTQVAEQKEEANPTPADAPEPTPTISFHALQGRVAPSTLRLEGSMNGVPVIILIDTGSTHNFLQMRVAKHAKLAIEPSKHLNVTIGNGDELLCEGLCKEVPLLLDQTSFKIDFHLLPIYGADAVLGAQWLADLGPTLFDYKRLWMSFSHAGHEVKLHGLQPHGQLAQLTFGQLRKAQKADAIASFHQLTMIPQLDEAGEVLLPMIPEHLNKGQRDELVQLLEQNRGVFTKPKGLPPARGVDHQLPLIQGTAPINVRPYRYPKYQKVEIEKLVQEMLQEGIIRPSSSPFSSPVLLVKKKDGTWRFCVDFRALNSATIKNRFPIPTADELFDELHGACVFSKLDLRSGYHQIRMKEEDIPKTAFRTHDGHFEFLVMPFGLTNAPATFQAAMNEMFRPQLRRHVLVFSDDILIYSKSWGDHLLHLHEVLSILNHHCYFAKAVKCDLARAKIQYLGHTISAQGVGVDPEKVSAIQGWPTPTTVKQMRSFLGLAGYYRRFIKHYAHITSPLTDLLRKDAFLWSTQATIAFGKLKEALTQAPTLALPDFNTIFEVETDASGWGMRAVLVQHHKPLAYFSRQFTPTMQRASTYARELCALVSAVQKWRHYLLGGHFRVHTDHQP